jgi:hypothetical protein
MKKLALPLLILVIILAGALFWLRGNLDSLVRDAIATYGSEMTASKVSVDQVKINATNGEGIITGLTIGNPKGFKTNHALKLSEFTVAIDPASLVSDVVIIKKIAIIAPDIIYEKGNTMTNFDAIQKNIANYLGPSEGSNQSSDKKLIVEELTIRDAKAQVSAAFMAGKTMTVNLPDITLRNLGKSKGGITSGELGNEIAGALKKQLTKSISFDKLSKAADAVKDGATKALDKVKGLF